MHDSQEVSLLSSTRYPSSVHIDFSRSTDRAIVATAQQIWMWSIGAQKEMISFSCKSSLYCVAISANGKHIVSGRGDGTFMRWDAANGDPVESQLKHKQAV